MFSYEYPHPAVTVDVAVFCLNEGNMKLLLIKRANYPDAGKWALPGGFIEIDEDLEPAARRELEEETGLVVGELEQLQTFGNPDRDPRERVITVVYTTIVDPGNTNVSASTDAAEAAWFDTRTLPELAFDHSHIIGLACDRIMSKLGNE